MLTNERSMNSKRINGTYNIERQLKEWRKLWKSNRGNNTLLWYQTLTVRRKNTQVKRGCKFPHEIPAAKLWMWSTGGVTLTAEDPTAQKETCACATLSTTNSTLMGLHGEKPDIIIIFFYVLLTVNPNIMIVFFFYQLDEQILYFNTVVTFLYMSSRNLCTEQSPKESDNTRCCTNTIVLLKMSTIVLETCRVMY